MLMNREPAVGKAGLSGWLMDLDDQEEYMTSVANAWMFWTRLWRWFKPEPDYVIAYQPKDSNTIAVIHPSQQAFMLIKRGGIVRHMRQVDELRNGIPVFEGTGKVMGPMTDREAMEFLAWKDMPRGVNHWNIIRKDSLPPTRERRMHWRLTEDGRVVC